MPLRTLNRVSPLVIVLSVVAFVGVPGLREGLRAAFKPNEYGAVPSRSVARNEQQSLVAEATSGMSSTRENAAYQQAWRLAPQSPAPHLIFARITAGQVPLNRTEKDALWPGAHGSQRSLTGDDRKRVAEGEAALDRAARLDPGNAAIDCLQAYLAIVQRQDDRALGCLRAMLGKRAWTFYDRDVTIAAYELVRRERSAREAAVATAAVSSPYWTWIRDFARVLKGMALIAEARGDHEQAIFLRQSGMHAGRLMMEHGYTLIEAITGSVMVEICAADALTPAERWEAEKQATPVASTDGGQRDGRAASIRQAE